MASKNRGRVFAEILWVGAVPFSRAYTVTYGGNVEQFTTREAAIRRTEKLVKEGHSNARMFHPMEGMVA